jgi:hypothetical protein
MCPDRACFRLADDGGDSHGRGSCGDVADDDGIGADDRPVADVDGAEDACTGADDDVVADRRIATIIHVADRDASKEERPRANPRVAAFEISMP